MKFISTATSGGAVGAAEAILKGICGDGKVYVPSSFPLLKGEALSDMIRQDFPERMAKVLSMFIEELPFEKLLNIANKAYERINEFCTLTKIEEGLYVGEMWYGVNGCAEELVYSIYPYVVEELVHLKPYAVVYGTSFGARAMLDGFGRASGAAAFYAADSTNDFERRRLTSIEEFEGASVVAVEGGAQQLHAKLKEVVADEKLLSKLREKGVLLCPSGGSDVLKIIILVAIYASAYCDLVGSDELVEGEEFNVAMPAGELDFAVAGSYARRMGVPIKTIILATNANNAVVELVEEGKFDADRDFYRTISEDLDILVPTELERFVYELTGRRSEVTAEAMRALGKHGGFELDVEEDFEDASLFRAGWADEEDTKQTIFSFFDLDDYIMDAHTAVTASVFNDYACESEDDAPTLLLSCTSPCNTAIASLEALGTKEKNPFKAVDKLADLTAAECPLFLYEMDQTDEIPVTKANIEELADIIFERATAK